MTQVAFPWSIDRRGRTAEADLDQHVRDLIEQVLMTSPGERVNRPSFGSGLLRVPFSPLRDEVGATVQFMVQGSLQQWLGDRLEIHGVLVDVTDSTLDVTVQYVVRRTREQQVATFSREL